VQEKTKGVTASFYQEVERSIRRNAEKIWKKTPNADKYLKMCCRETLGEFQDMFRCAFIVHFLHIFPVAIFSIYKNVFPSIHGR
jgi:translation initiation factor 2 alpha subunit (eIF-2alpha)